MASDTTEFLGDVIDFAIDKILQLEIYIQNKKKHKEKKMKNEGWRKATYIRPEDLNNPDLFDPDDFPHIYLMSDKQLFRKYGYIVTYGSRNNSNNSKQNKEEESEMKVRHITFKDMDSDEKYHLMKDSKTVGNGKSHDKKNKSDSGENSYDHNDNNGKNDDRKDPPKPPKKKINKIPIIIAVIVFLVLTFITSIYHVTEQEQAVVTRFGKVIDIKSAGLYFRIPYFIDDIHKVHTTTYGLPIGYVIDPDSQQEGQSGEAVSTNDSVMITSDFNLLDVDFYLEYKVGDPIKYLYNSSDPVSILKNLTISAIRTVISDYTVDAVMTTDKSKIQSDIKTLLQDSLERTDIGLQVVNISMQDAEPPTADIMAAFKSVETAKQNAETAITNANQYNSEQIPNAEAEADKIVQDAEAIKAQRIAEADNEVETFNKTYNEYKKYPLITKKRMFYETMEEMLPDLKVIITDGQTDTMLPLDLFSYNNITTTPAATEAQQ